VLALHALVELVPDGAAGDPTLVEVALRGGEVRTARRDVNVAATDLPAQRRRLEEKFVALARGVLGDARTLQLRQTLSSLHANPSVRELMALARR
jgi:hypothetical protein